MVEEGLTDADLIAASLSEPEVFEDVFRRHYQPVRAYLQRRIGADVGEELAAQTFVVAFDQRDRFDASYPSSRAWLFAIATNLLRHHARDEERHRRLLMQNVTKLAPRWLEHDDDRLAAALVFPALLRALSGLEPRDRDAFLLFALADLSYDEVAKALDIPIGTVRSRISRARRLVRERVPSLEAIMSVNERPKSEGSSDG